MAYREIGMWEILEALRRVARGERQRAIRRWVRVAPRGDTVSPDASQAPLAARTASRSRPGWSRRTSGAGWV